MAGNPKPSYKFPKGHKFGLGRPKVSDDVKAARKFNSSEFELAANKVFFMSVQDLFKLFADGKKLFVDSETTVMEAIIGRIALKGLKDGSKDEINYFVERFMGKITENHNFTGNANPDLVRYIAEVNKSNAEREINSGEKEVKGCKESKD